uniref:Uncharacterized protein n=1 Tax=Anguilla anguilla TaxID=7936 RepID=A0A0E9P8E0_ANGAN
MLQSLVIVSVNWPNATKMKSILSSCEPYRSKCFDVFLHGSQPWKCFLYTNFSFVLLFC